MTRFCNQCQESKHLSAFTQSRLESGRKQCKECIHKYNKKRYAANKVYEKNTRKLRKILGQAFGVEHASGLINPFKIRQLIESNGIDVATCKDVNIYPPKDSNDIQNLNKYQIITY